MSAAVPVSPFDLTSPEFIADPYPAYRHLREQMPVCRDERTGFLLVTRYADVYPLLRDKRLSSDQVSAFMGRLPAEQQAALAPLAGHPHQPGHVHRQPGPPPHPRADATRLHPAARREDAAGGRGRGRPTARPGAGRGPDGPGGRPGRPAAVARHLRDARPAAGGPGQVQGLDRRHLRFPGPQPRAAGRPGRGRRPRRGPTQGVPRRPVRGDPPPPARRPAERAGRRGATGRPALRHRAVQQRRLASSTPATRRRRT